ncbi:MAG: heme ABC exporter ATP-binding protein CcmA [Nitrososphaerota archaeon]|nr:heme ABC exporter ATP-binding protein CcmA [Nitrososphaerota archaeon]
MHSLELKNVDSGYDGSQVLHKINFKLDQPSIYVVLGPNGAGKTTLFRTISGILQPYAGSVELDGESLVKSKEARHRINYLSHYNAIPEEMTVSTALKFYSDIEGGNTEEVMHLLNLEGLRNSKISDLSQGQKKRVSIAKVFLRERDLYLLDEPTANLDPGVSKEIRDILLKLSKDKIVLYSSHNLYEAQDVGTYLILIKNGSVSFFDRISNIRSKEYRIGIRATTDISKFVDAQLNEAGYYVLSVSTPEEAGRILRELVNKGVLVTEMRQLDNPLQDLFDGQSEGA